MATFKEILYMLDFFSPKPEVKFQGKSRFKNIFGVGVGFFSIIMLLSIYGFYIYETIARTKFQLHFTQKSDIKPIISLKNKKMALSIFNRFGKNFEEQDRIVKIMVKFWTVKYPEISDTNKDYINDNLHGDFVDVPMRDCNDIMDRNFSSTFEQLTLMRPNTKCIDMDNFKEKIYGRFGYYEE